MAEKVNTKKTSVTIKDIAARLNISSTSVHRALSGRGGVSEELRKQIMETAGEMGYEINYAAASIKRKSCRIAVVFPQDNGLYFSNVWQGIRKSLNEVRGLNVELAESVCRDEQHQYELLKQIADAEGEYMGVITFSYTRSANVLLQLQRLVAQKVAVIVIDDELTEPEGLYCIPSNEKAVGRVAGEFIGLITPQQGTVIVSEGRPDSKIHINKVKSFQAYLANTRPGLKIRIAQGYSKKEETREAVYQAFKKAFMEASDVVAGYALTAQDNELMVRAAEDAGRAGQAVIVGTDLNNITAQLLKEGRMKAVVDQAAYTKGYISLQILVEKVIKNIAPPQRADCPIDIILQSNLNFCGSLNSMVWK